MEGWTTTDRHHWLRVRGLQAYHKAPTLLVPLYLSPWKQDRCSLLRRAHEYLASSYMLLVGSSTFSPYPVSTSKAVPCRRKVEQIILSRGHLSMSQKSITTDPKNSTRYKSGSVLPSFANGFGSAFPRVDEYSTTTSTQLLGATRVSMPNVSSSRRLPPPTSQGNRALFPLRSLPYGPDTTGTANATIDAKASPLLSDRSRSLSRNLFAGHALPPLRSDFPQQQITAPSSGQEWIPRVLTLQSDSPSTSYSSSSQLNRASPASLPHSSATTPAYSSDHYGPIPTKTSPPGDHCLSRSSDTSHSSMTGITGQDGAQFMALATDQGPIQVPVDVQAASKMADEKRKRNAGASARFRQRRKEKEKEASSMIAKLEGQIREISEEREHYRLERDYFRGIVYSTPGLAQLTPGLPFPQQRQVLQPRSSELIIQ